MAAGPAGWPLGPGAPPGPVGWTGCGGACMFCNWLCRACTDDCSLSSLDFSSSIESLTDCTWPETESTFPLMASFCAASFCCSVSMVASILAALSAVCWARVWTVVKRVSSVDCSLCTMSSNCWTCVWRAMISLEAARA